MTRLVRPYLTIDQARALIAAAEDRAFKLSLAQLPYPQQGNREPVLLAGAAVQLKEALTARESEAAPAASRADLRRD